MKTVLLGFLQFLLFLGVFLVGSFLNPFHLQWFVTHPTLASTRFFAPGGLLLAVGVYLLVVLAEAATKRMQMAAVSTVALALAVVLGLAAKFGWVTR